MSAWQHKTMPTAPLREAIERAYPYYHNNRGRGCEDSLSAFIAEVAGVSVATIHRIMSGHSESVRIDVADKICCALDIHPLRIFGEQWLTSTCSHCGGVFYAHEFPAKGSMCYDCIRSVYGKKKGD